MSKRILEVASLLALSHQFAQAINAAKYASFEEAAEAFNAHVMASSNVTAFYIFADNSVAKFHRNPLTGVMTITAYEPTEAYIVANEVNRLGSLARQVAH